MDAHTRRGIRQVSVGTILFLVYSNDVTHIIRHGQIRLFPIYTSPSKAVDNTKREEERETEREWGDEMFMDDDLVAIPNWPTFSALKSETLIIFRKSCIEEHPPLYIDGNILKVLYDHHHNVFSCLIYAQSRQYFLNQLILKTLAIM